MHLMRFKIGREADGDCLAACSPECVTLAADEWGGRRVGLDGIGKSRIE